MQSDEQTSPDSIPDEQITSHPTQFGQDHRQGDEDLKAMDGRRENNKTVSKVIKSHEDRLEALKHRSEDWAPIDVAKALREKQFEEVAENEGKGKLLEFPHSRNMNPEYFEVNKKRLTTKFARELRKGYRNLIPHSADRRELASELAGTRHKGIRKSEVRKSVEKLVGEGKISELRAKKIEKKLGVYRRPQVI